MAAGRMVNLGQVGFGLVAETDGLRQSLELLKAFGREVDRLSRQTSEASQALFKKFSPLEATLTRMQTSTDQTIRRMQSLGASAKEIGKVETAFRKAHDELIKFADDVQPNRIQRATIGLQSIQQRALAEAQAQRKARDEEARVNEQASRINAQLVQAEIRNQQRAVNEKIAAQSRFSQYVAREREIQQRRDLETYRMAGAEQNRITQIAQARDVETFRAAAIERRRIERETNRALRENAAQERAVTRLDTRAQVAGIDPRLMQQTRQSLTAFQAISGSDEGARTRALINLRGAISATDAAILKANGGTTKFALALRDLERAAILALGPLSGIGARLAVLSALFDATTFKTAVTIAGITGVGAALAFMSAASVKAAMDQQRFEAVLTASTGAAVLAKDEYERVVEIANKWGVNIREMVDPYAKFTAAARLSNMSLQETQTTFEAITVASRALHLNTQRTGLVFLAFEQMLSKGTVTMEELRRQLGDLLPGAFAVAARAMGMTQEQFNKAIRNGEVLAKDLIPKLSAALLTLYGPAALKASQNLQAELEKLSNSLFKLQNAFSDVTGITDIFTSMVRGTTSVLDFMANNMRDMIGLVGALAGAGGMMLLVSWLGRLNLSLKSITLSIRGLGAAVVAFDIITLTTGVGALLKVLLKLGAVAAGAAVGFHMMKPAAEDATESIEDFLTATKGQIDQWKQLGEVDAQTAQLMEMAFNKRYTILAEEIVTLEESIAAKTNLMTKWESTQRALYGTNFDAMIKSGRLKRPTDEGGQVEDDPEVKAMKARLARVRALIAEMNEVRKAANAVPVRKEETGDSETKAWERYVNSVEKEIRKLEGINQRIANFEFGPEAMRQAEALAMAIETIERMPEGKDRGNIQPLIDSLQKAGFEGDQTAGKMERLKSQLQQLFASILQSKDTLKEMEQFPEKAKRAWDGVFDMMDDLDSRKRAALAVNPEEFTRTTALEKNLKKIHELLSGVNADQEVILYIQRLYRESWGDTTDLEDHKKKVEGIRQEYERLMDQMGSKSDKAEEQFRDRTTFIQNAVMLSAVTETEALAFKEKAFHDYSVKVLADATLFGRAMKDVFKDIEDGVVRSFVNMAKTGKFEIKDLFVSILEEIYAFMIRMAVVVPIMEGLFGRLYNPQLQNSRGAGLLGQFVLAGAGSGVQGLFGGAGGTIGGFDSFSGYMAASPLHTPWLGAAEFASGGRFKVEGSGGTDSQLVRFMATPGEIVTIETPDQYRDRMNIGESYMSLPRFASGGAFEVGGGSVSMSSSAKIPQVKVIVNNETGIPADVTASPPQIQGDEIVYNLVMRRLVRDSSARRDMNALLSNPSH